MPFMWKLLKCLNKPHGDLANKVKLKDFLQISDWFKKLCKGREDFETQNVAAFVMMCYSQIAM